MSGRSGDAAAPAERAAEQGARLVAEPRETLEHGGVVGAEAEDAAEPLVDRHVRAVPERPVLDHEDGHRPRHEPGHRAHRAGGGGRARSARRPPRPAARRPRPSPPSPRSGARRRWRPGAAGTSPPTRSAVPRGGPGGPRDRAPPRPGRSRPGRGRRRPGARAPRGSRPRSRAALTLTGGMIPPGRRATSIRTWPDAPPERRRARGPRPRWPRRSRPGRRRRRCSLRVARPRARPMSTPHDASDSLDALAEVLEALRATRSRLEKRRLLVDYLQALPDEALPLAVTYLGGRPFPRGDGRTLVGGRRDARCRAPGGAAGADRRDRHGRLAPPRRRGRRRRRALDRTPRRPIPRPSGSPDVAASFEALHAARGPRAKAALLVDAFRRMDARAIRAFVKAMLGEARIGVQEQTLEDAVAHATGQPIEAVRAANRHRADLGAVALEARRGRLEPARFAYFTPVDPMLAQPAADAADAVRRLGTPLWVEDKYDGVRCQLHKVDADVRLFSRDRRELTPQFPEVVAAFAAAPGPLRPRRRGPRDGGRPGAPLPPPPAAPRAARARRRTSWRRTPSPSSRSTASRARTTGSSTRRSGPGAPTLEALPLPPGQTLAPVWTATSAEELDALFHGGPGPGERGADGEAARGALRVGPPRRPVAQGQASARDPRRRGGRAPSGATGSAGPCSRISRSPCATRRTGRLVTIGKAYNGLTDVEIREMTERLLAPHRRGPRPLPDRAARDRPRGGLQPPPALGAPHLRLRAPLPAHRARPPGPAARDREHARRRGPARGHAGGRWAALERIGGGALTARTPRARARYRTHPVFAIPA